MNESGVSVISGTLTVRNSEKHSKKEEALAQLKAGIKFDQVAKDFSEDKGKQGEFLGAHLA